VLATKITELAMAQVIVANIALYGEPRRVLRRFRLFGEIHASEIFF